MTDPNTTALASDPRPLLETLRGPRGLVFRRSNLFRRDLQYGLWRFLNRDQSKYPYEAMEKITDDLVDAWIRNGVVRRIDHKSYELLLPDYEPKSAPAEASAPESAPSAPATTEAKPSPAAAADDEVAKQARIAELQRKMAEAKARREQGG